MKRGSDASLRSRSTVFPSSGAPRDRLQLQVSSGRRGHGSSGGAAALLPLGSNRRSVPSKWEDAEKWICSPVSMDGLTVKSADPRAAHRRRPKSKSGPLGPHCEPCLPNSSVMHDLDDGRAKTYTANSPALREALVEDGGFVDASMHPRGGGVDGFFGWEGRANFARPDDHVWRATSVTVPGWSELLVEASSSLPTSQDVKHRIMQDGARSVTDVLRKDVGTQMSPQGSTCSSPDARPQTSSNPPHSLTIGELHKHFSKLEVRDVQVDDQVTMKRWSKRHFPRGSDKSSSHAKQRKKKSSESGDSAWEVAGLGKHMSKLETEEARIVAWENLQKAKAEAAIRELEMKLEKKRSSSMDKILNELSSAQKKAEEMRKSLTDSQEQRVDATSRRAKLFQRTNRPSFLNGCFYGHAL